MEELPDVVWALASKLEQRIGFDHRKRPSLRTCLGLYASVPERRKKAAPSQSGENSPGSKEQEDTRKLQRKRDEKAMQKRKQWLSLKSNPDVRNSAELAGAETTPVDLADSLRSLLRAF